METSICLKITRACDALIGLTVTFATPEQSSLVLARLHGRTIVLLAQALDRDPTLDHDLTVLRGEKALSRPDGETSMALETPQITPQRMAEPVVHHQSSPGQR